jgi:CRISPR-associated endonuclease/helicase Cas3
MIELYSHQARVFDLISAGKNIILQAPTGSGKTRAALYPFIAMADKKYSPLPRKCIYSVPMRVLAKQFNHEYRRVIDNHNLEYGLNLSVKIQTGEQADDPMFASNLVFATIDQTLSRFLLNPYGVSKRKANINAAAVMASYLVFDEFHLYDPISTLPTTLHMLQMLKGITPFILMTATFSKDMLDGLASVLDAEVVQLTSEELACLPSQKKTRRYHTPDSALNADAVLREHCSRSLVICNTIDRARAIHAALNAAKDADTEVLLLHSRFLSDDRNTIEERIRERFASGDKSGGSLIIVSTQAIEVGVDITSENLHTELAPANSIIQRAGRCARYEGDTGDVYIYGKVETPDEDIDLREHTLPYKALKPEFELTLEQFQMRSTDALGFAEEQAIISAVHGARDQKILDELSMTAHVHRRKIYTAMRDAEGASELIRDMFQQRVTLSDDPDSLRDSPFDAPSFGVFPNTLQKWVTRWLEIYHTGEHEMSWAVKYLHQPEREEANAGLENAPRYDWIKASNAKSVLGAGLVVVNPKLASYDPVMGFQPDVPTADEDLPWLRERFQLPPRKQWQDNSYTYKLETYEEHIAQVYRAAFAYDGAWWEMADTAARLERCFGWEVGSIRRAAELAVLLHDVGKLSVKWQGWVQKYQKQIGKTTESGKAYAHTDFDWREDEHQKAQQKTGKRPWHAVEGALSVFPFLSNVFGESILVEAVYSTIARHHSPRSIENKAYQLIPRSAQHIQDSLVQANVLFPLGISEQIQSLFGLLMLEGINDVIEENTGQHENLILEVNDAPTNGELQGYMVYWLLVRVLRLADQTGTQEGVQRI